MAENAIISMNRKMPQVELRDLFAMNALSFLSGGNWNGTSGDWILKKDESSKTIATIAYKIADAMLEARKDET